MKKIIIVLALFASANIYGQTRSLPAGGSIGQYPRIKNASGGLEWATLTTYTGGRGITVNSGVIRLDSTKQYLFTNGLKFGSATYFINSSGNTYFNNGGAATKFSAPMWEFAGNSTMTSATDGSIKLTYNVGSDFDRLQFGGTSNAFPSQQRKGVKLVARLADNSGNTHLQVKDTVYGSPWNGRIDVPTMNAVYDKVETLVKYTDTATMLTKYLRSADTLKLRRDIDLKVKYTDTAAMLTKYLRSADTVKLHNQIAARVKVSDTAAMLSPYALESQVYSGTYSPSTSDLTNVTSTSFTGHGTRYMRIGSRVFVSGCVNVTVTTNNLSTSFELSLPISSTLGSFTTDISGTISGSGDVPSGIIGGDNNHAQPTWGANTIQAGTYTMCYQYSYNIN